jgi:hypothetical protein
VNFTLSLDSNGSQILKKEGIVPHKSLKITTYSRLQIAEPQEHWQLYAYLMKSFLTLKSYILN